jgi:hypothetical protein
MFLPKCFKRIHDGDSPLAKRRIRERHPLKKLLITLQFQNPEAERVKMKAARLYSRETKCLEPRTVRLKLSHRTPLCQCYLLDLKSEMVNSRSLDEGAEIKDARRARLVARRA